MTRPLAFLALAVAAMPACALLGAVGATVWFELVYSPRLNAEWPVER